MGELAKILIALGLVLTAAGVLLLLYPKLSLPGRLPGDLVVKRDNVTFLFPIATSIVISILFSLVLYLIDRFK